MAEDITKSEDAPQLRADLAAKKLSKNISYKVISDRKVNLTKELAERHINLPTFPGERDLRDSHVDDLVNAAKEGQFLFGQCSISTCMCEWDGLERRLNGQHTCWMRIYMPDSWDCTINVVRYSAPTEDDFRRLYSCHDRGAPRTRSHIIISRVYDTPEWHGISMATIKMIQSGLSFYLEKDRSSETKLSADKLASLMNGEQLPLCLHAARLFDSIGITKKTFVHLRRGAVVGAMFATVHRSQSDSKEFWQAVADGLNIESKTDGRYKLRESLLQHRVEPGASTALRPMKETCNSESMYKLCINAWNKWRAGEPVHVLVPTKTRVAAK